MKYNEKFFEMEDLHARRAAPRAVRFLNDLLGCSRVVDVGCGRGAWSLEFRKLGCEVTAIDGSTGAMGALTSAGCEFIQTDLTSPSGVPTGFELALCLEVAEHLPVSAAAVLVDVLAHSAQAVFFSAAIPGQGGAHHVNEQWQSWWAALFAKRGLYPSLCFRDAFWNDLEVAYWYSQNGVVYVPIGHPILVSDCASAVFDVVHPRAFRAAVARTSSSRVVARELPAGLIAAARRRLGAPNIGENHGA